ncbi:MAG: S-layer homology domain-containing protein [Candidatus Roizmanbacteria bacterium]|nr:S-layer homology domain-containing protein [Candidatus Roizmanbacteria bacterium]
MDITVNSDDEMIMVNWDGVDISGENPLFDKYRVMFEQGVKDEVSDYWPGHVSFGCYYNWVPGDTDDWSFQIAPTEMQNDKYEVIGERTAAVHGKVNSKLDLPVKYTGVLKNDYLALSANSVSDANGTGTYLDWEAVPGLGETFDAYKVIWFKSDCAHSYLDFDNMAYSYVTWDYYDLRGLTPGDSWNFQIVPVVKLTSANKASYAGGKMSSDDYGNDYVEVGKRSNVALVTIGDKKTEVNLETTTKPEEKKPEEKKVEEKKVEEKKTKYPEVKGTTEKDAKVKTPKAGFEDEVVTFGEQTGNPFSDTNIYTLSGRSAADLYFRGVIGGYTDGTFRGDQPVNRAEAAKFLLLGMYGKVPANSGNNPFSDVIVGEWYAPFVLGAYDLGILSGYIDGTLHPENTVNTAEFLKMLTLTFDVPTGMEHSFIDVDSGAWYAQYAGVAEQYNLFPNRGKYLMPSSLLTRDEVAVAIFNLINSFGN